MSDKSGTILKTKANSKKIKLSDKRDSNRIASQIIKGAGIEELSNIEDHNFEALNQKKNDDSSSKPLSGNGSSLDNSKAFSAKTETLVAKMGQVEYDNQVRSSSIVIAQRIKQLQLQPDTGLPTESSQEKNKDQEKALNSTR